jgi:hypothetical protein
MEEHDGAFRMEPGELLQPIARPVRPRCERAADARLERRASVEDRLRTSQIAIRVERLGPAQRPRLLVVAHAEIETERRSALRKILVGGRGHGGRAVPLKRADRDRAGRGENRRDRRHADDLRPGAHAVKVAATSRSAGLTSPGRNPRVQRYPNGCLLALQL